MDPRRVRHTASTVPITDRYPPALLWSNAGTVMGDAPFYGLGGICEVLGTRVYTTQGATSQSNQNALKIVGKTIAGGVNDFSIALPTAGDARWNSTIIGHDGTRIIATRCNGNPTSGKIYWLDAATGAVLFTSAASYRNGGFYYPDTFGCVAASGDLLVMDSATGNVVKLGTGGVVWTASPTLDLYRDNIGAASNLLSICEESGIVYVAVSGYYDAAHTIGGTYLWAINTTTGAVLDQIFLPQKMRSGDWHATQNCFSSVLSGRVAITASDVLTSFAHFALFDGSKFTSKATFEYPSATNNPRSAPRTRGGDLLIYGPLGDLSTFDAWDVNITELKLGGLPQVLFAALSPEGRITRSCKYPLDPYMTQGGAMDLLTDPSDNVLMCATNPANWGALAALKANAVGQTWDPMWYVRCGEAYGGSRLDASGSTFIMNTGAGNFAYGTITSSGRDHSPPDDLS